MSKGFFASSLVISEAPPSLLPKCGACGLFKTCKSPKMPPTGRGERKVLIVGEAPGATEDEENKQFIGKAGEHLKSVLQKIGVHMRSDCWVTNALICRPPDNKIADKRMIDYCRPNLMKTIAELKPHVIILLGGSAVRSLIGEVWRENPGELGRWVGWNIPCQKTNAWICPTYHPSYLLREHNPVLDLYFEKHLEKAFSHESHPWETVPDWEKQVEVVIDTDKAARILREFTEEGGDIAFDYENTALKPEYKGAEIVCASACHQGKRTIAYPWHGAVKEATRDMLHADNCRFIASNLKHEDRWTRHEFGRPVRHWAWDTMLAAHTLDNREAVTGLKFQAYVHLGLPAYDDHIKKFLRAMKGKQTNLAKQEVDLRQLLHYCAIDSLLEYKLARRQVRLLESRPRPHLPLHVNQTEEEYA